jgi:hypothetical protein
MGADAYVPVCYICLEEVRDPTDVGECACRAPVHAACLLKAVAASDSLVCGICKEGIANVQKRERWRLQVTMPCGFRVASFVCGTVLDVLAIVMLYEACATRFTQPQFFEVLLVICATFAFLGTLGFWLGTHLETMYRDRACVAVRHAEYDVVVVV